MALINLAQVKGGKQLQNDVSAMLKSYDAEKVLTKIVKTPAKDGAPAVNYNVEDMLNVLNQAVDALNGKKIKDIVRVEIPVADGKATIPADLAKRVPNVDMAAKVLAYSMDNEVLLNEKGEQLTVDLATGVFNGTPSVIDEEASAKQADGTYVYKPLTLAKLKVFVQGEWKLNELPADALLDNDEMQLVAYETTLDKLAVKVAKNSDILNAVKEQIGQKAIADQLSDKADITDVYTDATKVTPLFRKANTKLKLDDLDKDLQDVIKTAAEPKVFDPTELINEDAKKLDKANVVVSTVDRTAEGYAASDDKVLSEKATADMIQKAIATAAPSEKQVIDTVAVAGDAAVTEFALTEVPNDKKVKMNINHLVYLEGEDFTVDRAGKKATWTQTEKTGGFDIDKDVTDKVFIEYFAKA